MDLSQDSLDMEPPHVTGQEPSSPDAPPPPLERRDAAFVLAVLAVALAAYSLELGALALWSRDETTYARIAQEMLRTGDWLTLRYGGVNWFCHPPLYFWMVAITMRVVDSAELAARLPSALFGAGGVALAWLWGRTLFSHRAGLFAAVAMGVNLQYFGQSRLAIIDTTFLFFLSASMLGLWWGLRGWRPGWHVMFVAAGLSCLAKGPYGLLFPAAVGLPYIALTGQWRRLREVPWATGLPVALGLGAAWYVAEIVLWGRDFSSQVLGYYFIGRFTTQVLRQGGPPWFYVPVLLVGWFPWSLFLPAALVAAWKAWRRSVGPGGATAPGDPLPLLMTWIVLTFVGLSVARTKLPNYIFFLYPAAAVLVAWFLDRSIRDGAWRRVRVPLAVGGAALLAVVLALRFWAEGRFPLFQEDLRLAEWICLLPVAGMAAALALMARSSSMIFRSAPVGSLAIIAVAGSTLLFLLVAVVLVGPRVELHRPVRPLVAQALGPLRLADRVACYEEDTYGVAYYADRDVERIRTASQLRALFLEPRRVVVVMPRDRLPELQGAEGVRVEATVRDAVVVSGGRR